MVLLYSEIGTMRRCELRRLLLIVLIMRRNYTTSSNKMKKGAGLMRTGIFHVLTGNICRYVAVTAIAVTAGVVAMGCRGPHMASRPLNPQEKTWAETIKKYYPGWRIPERPPMLQKRFSGSPGARYDSSATGLKTLPSTGISAGVTDEKPRLRAGRPGQSAAEKTRLYTVQKGDTLSSIAENFYGSSRQWRRIYKTNKDKLAAPGDLSPGMKLRIPLP